METRDFYEAIKDIRAVMPSAVFEDSQKQAGDAALPEGGKPSLGSSAACAFDFCLSSLCSPRKPTLRHHLTTFPMPHVNVPDGEEQDEITPDLEALNDEDAAGDEALEDGEGPEVSADFDSEVDRLMEIPPGERIALLLERLPT